MALIICPECNKSVSDSASVCPYCGYPILQYVQNKLFDTEVNRLMDKIKPVNFVCPEPRAKVCVKCGEPFCNDGTPYCQCGIGGKHFPGVEVDYPLVGWGTQFGSERYIHTDCVIPMNIGDQESEEYIQYEASINERIEKYEDACRTGARKRHWIFEATPPKEEWFGQQPFSREEIEQIHNYFSQPTPSKPDPLLPHCPFCSSTDLSKISNLGKAVKLHLFGLLGADDLGKTYKCNNCGGKF